MRVTPIVRARQPGRLGSRMSGRLTARIGRPSQQRLLGRPPRDKPCGQSLMGRCPQRAVTRECHRRERSTAAMAAWLQWLARSSGERRRQHQWRAPFDPRRRPAADRRQALPGDPAGQRRQRAGQRRLVVWRASGGQPAGPRRLAVPGSPVRPFGVSEPAAFAARGPQRPWHGPFESVGPP